MFTTYLNFKGNCVGMTHDRFGIPWMVNCDQQPAAG